MNQKTKVNCDVVSCIHNNKKEKDCDLNNLSISSMGRGSECDNTYSTICQSFEKSGGIITDNEYEVSSEFMPEETDI